VPSRNLSAAQRAGSATLAAEQSEYGAPVPSTTRTDVGPVAPEIDWDYAVIERLESATLKTVLIPFDLGRLVLQHDASQDLPLQPGDVVSIFSQGDIRVPVAQQTKYVRLDGEFVHAGVYTVQPGETLRDLVQRAGGLTAAAYLFGSEFTRESTRAIQQRRMDEYVQTLEMQMQRGNLALASSPASSAQDLASGAAAQNSEQGLLARLRQMQATGRIVLEFKAGSSGLDVLPDIALEDGDRFVIPPVPASVNVVGAVYDQNSFLYQTARRAGAYLHLAGGPNRDADTKHIFIIRADGSVISRAAENGIWGNEFDNLRMNPGDTIVVPEKTFKPSALRGILDWSQLFSQFALGAAALSVIQ
jgi:protein involved in polysaccharide export with SLBB domain